MKHGEDTKEKDIGMWGIDAGDLQYKIGQDLACQFYLALWIHTVSMCESYVI